MNETMQCMRGHSSVRSFTDQAIEADLLHQILACGQAASSSSFIQGCSVIRVQDPATRRIIAEAAGNQQWIIDAAEFLVFCADMKRIAYCTEKSGQGELGGFTEHFISTTVDAALMAQNVLLAAESAGLGGVFIGGIRNDPQVLCDCLQLPELVYPVFGMCLGWPAQKNEVKPRMPLSMVLHEESYDDEQIPAQVDGYDETIREYYQSRGSNLRDSDWSTQTARAIQGKTREHMLEFLRQRGFLLR